MGINAQQFNGYGNLNLQPGMVLGSLAESTSGVYSLSTAAFSTVVVSQANLFVAGNFTVVATQNTTGRVLTGLLIQGAAIDPLLIASLLSQALNPLYNVSFNAGNFTFTAKTPGTTGVFSIVLPGGTFNGNAVVDPLPLLPGRIVVNDNTLWTATQNNFNISVAYPTTANATTNSLAGLYVTGFGDIVNCAPSPFDNSQDGNRLFQGNVVELYKLVDAFVMQSVTPISSFAPIFVETSTANSGRDTGKITAVANATTIPLPASRLSVVQGTASAGGMVIAQLN
jgi:hypothetical protein